MHCLVIDFNLVIASDVCSYGVTPNILVVPPSMLLYLSLAPEEKAGSEAFEYIVCTIHIYQHADI